MINGGEVPPGAPNRVPKLVFHDQVPVLGKTVINSVAELPPGVSWQSLGRCGDEPPATMFPSDDKGAEIAKRICTDCQVQPVCLNWALKNRVDHGVWGGADEKERRRMVRQRRVNGQ